MQKRNKGYSPEWKEQVAAEYRKVEDSQDFPCQKDTIRGKTQLRNRIKVNHAHGSFRKVKFSGGGSCRKQGRQDITQEDRIEIAQYCIKSGRNYGEAAKKYNVSYQQAGNWTLSDEELGEKGLEDRRGQRKRNQTPRTEEEALRIRKEQLEQEIHEQKAENDFLKKLQELERGEIPLRSEAGHRYSAVRDCHEEKGDPIDPLCRIGQGSQAAYDKRAAGKFSRREAENEKLAEIIEKIHVLHPDMGFRRI